MLSELRAPLALLLAQLQLKSLQEDYHDLEVERSDLMDDKKELEQASDDGALHDPAQSNIFASEASSTRT